MPDELLLVWDGVGELEASAVNAEDERVVSDRMEVETDADNVDPLVLGETRDDKVVVAEVELSLAL